MRPCRRSFLIAQRKTDQVMARLLNADFSEPVDDYETQVRKLFASKVAPIKKAKARAVPRLTVDETYQTARVPRELWQLTSLATGR